MPGRQPIPHVHRQQKRLIPKNSPIRPRHQTIFQDQPAASGRHADYATGSATTAIADYLADGGTDLDAWAATTTGVEVTVTCTRNVQIAFGWLFLAGDSLKRTAVASAQAPTL